MLKGQIRGLEDTIDINSPKVAFFRQLKVPNYNVLNRFFLWEKYPRKNNHINQDFSADFPTSENEKKGFRIFRFDPRFILHFTNNCGRI